jgi:exosortase/archaeosortase family protein
MIVEAGCSGFKQLFQVFFVFLLIPGLWKRKVWYVPAVLSIMFCATILHLLILSTVMANWPAYFQFTHVWASRGLFYTIMFSTWLIWEEKVGLSKN